MRLQVLDPSVAFACGSCTYCCDQPWRTLIEPEKARALDGHDFGKYPQLRGEKFYHAADDPQGRFALAKGEGNKCLFLDSDGLCIIHKEMGPEAKPHMCRQFPFLPARTWTEDRVSANFGCPSIQNHNGPPLAAQAADVAALVPLGRAEPNPDAPTPLDVMIKLTREETDALFENACLIFDENRDADVWSRFAELLAVLSVVRQRKAAEPRVGQTNPEIVALLRSGAPPHELPAIPSLHAFDRPGDAPMPARFLFAATLYPDTTLADSAASMGLLKRLTLAPRLMSLARLSGGYASRLLGRNVKIDEVLGYAVEPDLPPGATRLLVRYFRSRLWQRFLAGTRLRITGGIHQHIHDLNAILFFARADVHHWGRRKLDEGVIREALTRVEFHLANQSRLYDHTLKGWFRAQLDNLPLAMASLRLMSLQKAAVETTTVAEYP